VDEPDAQVGTDDPQVGIDEGTAVVGIQLPREPAAAKRLLEAGQQRLSIGRQGVGRIRDEARVVIDDEAQMRGHRLGVQGQKRPRGEVHDPQVVDAGGFEDLGGAGNVLAQEIAAALSVQVVLLQPAVDGRERRQRGIGLLPLPVEQFDRHAGKGAHLRQDPLLLFEREPPGFAPVRAPLGLERLEAALLEGVIPIFERASGDPLWRRLPLCGQGLGRGHLLQRGRQRPMVLN
jgi:hypothetical protein